MRTIALIITTATALTALTTCSTEPLPEPVLETLTQESTYFNAFCTEESCTSSVKIDCAEEFDSPKKSQQTLKL